MKYISVSLEIESLPEFYNRCALVLGKEGSYDCTKIEVSQERQDVLQKHYPTKQGFAYSWLMFGPKVNEDLTGEVVRIEDGFIVE